MIKYGNIFIALTDKIKDQPKELRSGQFLMNVLKEDYPELAQQIVNTNADCYYDDNRRTAFWVKLLELTSE